MIAIHSVRATLERNALVARRIWLVMLSGFLEPVLYLLAVGLGVGALLAPVSLGDGTVVDFPVFLAPALLAVSAMNGALYDATVNVFWKLRYRRLYDSMLTTPLTIRGVITGEIVWAQLRGFLYSLSFVGVLLAADLIRSPGAALAALPVTMLTGFAFAALGVAVTTFMRSWQDMELVTLGQTAMFFFSGTFFPVSSYPQPLRLLAELTPLHHANELIRSVCLGDVSAGDAGHACYLVAVIALAMTVAARRIDRLLIK
ncbi:ABC-2 type transporter [Streptomyces sp. YIM 130001]|uniref:ABC transporter permease n=1 Tax=Streptomyces sp. YIM 130001 TaxID=2259644 RepID=UPI000E656A97|nr:ABC transporter permease [Streptomyces sp. YIM 130001]RII07920.1 ABC-2 type transporter [Streptomyces sp. YIM 130001]